MVEQAQSVGAELRDASPVRYVTEASVTLANGDEHRADAIIAADGANGHRATLARAAASAGGGRIGRQRRSRR